MRNAMLSLALLAALPWAARAETGNFQIISGPGAGNTLFTVKGIVNGPGATNGKILPPHNPLLDPHYHFHGVLNANPDPAPDPNGTGWGLVNFTAPLTILNNLFPATARGTMTLTQSAPSLAFGQLFGPGAPDGPSEAAWDQVKEFLVRPDAANAAAHTPLPAALASAAAAWEQIQTTGPRAKPH